MRLGPRRVVPPSLLVGQEFDRVVRPDVDQGEGLVVPGRPWAKSRSDGPPNSPSDPFRLRPVPAQTDQYAARPGHPIPEGCLPPATVTPPELVHGIARYSLCPLRPQSDRPAWYVHLQFASAQLPRQVVIPLDEFDQSRQGFNLVRIQIEVDGQDHE